MKRYEDISFLVDRFLEGQTTLAEESRLNEFFMSHEAQLSDMPEHLQIAAEMFRDLRAIKEGKVLCEQSDFRRSPTCDNMKGRKEKPNYYHWSKWSVAIAAACVLLCFVLFSPNETNPKLEEKAIIVAQLSDVLQPDIINIQLTDNKPTDDQLVDAPKNKQIKRQTKPVEFKSEQEIDTSSTGTSEIHYEQTVQNGKAMLCGFNPNTNMLPMHTDVTTRAIMTECEMAILEEEFQISERNRQTIEI